MVRSLRFYRDVVGTEFSGIHGSFWEMLFGRMNCRGTVMMARLTAEARHSKSAQMSNHKLSVMCIECPYCDGENVIARAHAGHSELDLTDREIACEYCRSLFTISESAAGLDMRTFRRSAGPACTGPPEIVLLLMDFSLYPTSVVIVCCGCRRLLQKQEVSCTS